MNLFCCLNDGLFCLEQEAAEVRCLDFHPSGDFLLVGTQHPTRTSYDYLAT